LTKSAMFGVKVDYVGGIVSRRREKPGDRILIDPLSQAHKVLALWPKLDKADLQDCTMEGKVAAFCPKIPVLKKGRIDVNEILNRLLSSYHLVNNTSLVVTSPII
jgi:hypothetical protein